jgi:Ser/Thr protein kinase RdoA (MazF antagonist)
MGVDATLARTVAQFQVEGDLLDIAPFGSGHINDTYACRFAANGTEVRWVLQRLNHEVFTKPYEVMENIGRVTEHLRRVASAQGGDIDRVSLSFVHTTDGALLYEREDATYWRVCAMLEGARTYDEPTGPDQVYAAARAFGGFQTALSDLPGARLHETIPGFHHTPGRVLALAAAVAADRHGRAEEAADAIRFADERREQAAVVAGLMGSGAIPERVTHNDTKLNNVMFDVASGEALCVIDLDTVMPGAALYDFGDMVRVAANTGAEDDTDLARVGLDLELFGCLVEGYLAAVRGVLNGAEMEHLAFSARLMALEQGIRFLTDYLDGDWYYKVHRDRHNLERARAQFALVADMERKQDAMGEVVRRHG